MAIDFVGEIQAQDSAIKEQKRRDRAELYQRQDTAFQKNLSMDKMKLEAAKLNSDNRYKNAVLSQNQQKLMNDQINARAMIGLRQQALDNQANQFDRTFGQQERQFDVISAQKDRQLSQADVRLGYEGRRVDMAEEELADKMLTTSLGREMTAAQLEQFKALSPFVQEAAMGNVNAIQLGNELKKFSLDSQKALQPIMEERARLENLYKSGQLQKQEYENRLLEVSTRYADELAKIGVDQQKLALKNTADVPGIIQETAKISSANDYLDQTSKKAEGGIGKGFLAIISGNKFGSSAWEDRKVRKQLKKDIQNEGYDSIANQFTENLDLLKSGNASMNQILAIQNQATNTLNSLDSWGLNKGQEKLIRNRAQNMLDLIIGASKQQAAGK